MKQSKHGPAPPFGEHPLLIDITANSFAPQIDHYYHCIQWGKVLCLKFQKISTFIWILRLDPEIYQDAYSKMQIAHPLIMVWNFIFFQFFGKFRRLLTCSSVIVYQPLRNEQQSGQGKRLATCANYYHTTKDSEFSSSPTKVETNFGLQKLPVKYPAVISSSLSVPDFKNCLGKLAGGSALKLSLIKERIRSIFSWNNKIVAVNINTNFRQEWANKTAHHWVKAETVISLQIEMAAISH